MGTLRAFFGGSKKATTLLVGVLMLVFQNVLGIEAATADGIVTVIVGYLVGQGAVDTALALRGLKKA